MRAYVARGPAQLQKAADVIRSLNPEKVWQVEIGLYQEKRTLSQNKLYFAVITEMARETGHSKAEMHAAMKRKFLPPAIVTVADEEIIVPAESSKLGKQKFSEYVEQVIAFAVSELGLIV